MPALSDQTKSHFSNAVNVLRDVAYLGASHTEMLDAWLPPESFPRPVPAVLLIHGGGWAMGDKADAREENIAGCLSENGYAVFSINYLLEKKETDATGNPCAAGVWPQNFYDCKSALRYLRKEASRFGIEANRIAVMGGSAGGHLAMLVGMTAHETDFNGQGEHLEEANTVSCIVNFYGIPDVRKVKAHHFAGATEEKTSKNLKVASPISYLSPATPPILIVHGTSDETVPVEYSREFVQMLSKHKIPHDYLEIPGAPHSFHLEPKQQDLRPAVLSFLGKYLV